MTIVVTPPVTLVSTETSLPTPNVTPLWKSPKRSFIEIVTAWSRSAAKLRLEARAANFTAPELDRVGCAST